MSERKASDPQEPLAASPAALVVEDTPSIRGVLHDVLVEQGFVVVEHGTLGEARDALDRSGPFDVAVLDFMLPDGQGTALCGALRSRGVPCLVVSAYPDSLERSIDARADVWIGKPFEVEDLITAVRDLAGARLSALGRAAS